MNHDAFIFAAFAATGIGMGWLIVGSYMRMRRSEALADTLRQQP